LRRRAARRSAGLAEPIQAALDTGRRGRRPRQLQTLESASADLAAALEAARGQVTADTATAEGLRASLAAAQDKLAKLEATLAQAAATRTTTTETTPATGPTAEPHHDDDDEHEGGDD
jgi:hypothetical protein